MNNKIVKSYKFRLYPSKKEETKLMETLDLCRQTYNFLLQELNEQKVIDKSQIQGIIPDLKICEPKFNKLYSKTMQYECYRLFSNLRSLSKSKEKRNKVGSLRFKGKNWFKTFTYNQSGFKLIETGKRFQTLKLSKIGEIKIRAHRNIKGKIKQVTIKKEQSGKWFATITTEEPNKLENKLNLNKAVGIDLGLTNITHDSDNKIIQNPKHLNKHEQKLKCLQRLLSRKKKGSKNNEKARTRLAKHHEKILNIRNDFLHQISSRYVKNYDVIAIEDLQIKNMVKNKYLSKSISDASWNKLRRFLTYKAENAGKLLITVNPHGTTQRCSSCKNRVKKNLGNRIHKCDNCGLKIPRDYNSALEIKDIALKSIRQELSEYKHSKSLLILDVCIKPVEMPLAAELKIRSTSQALMKQETQERLTTDAQWL